MKRRPQITIAMPFEGAKACICLFITISLTVGRRGAPLFYDANRDLMRNFNWFHNSTLGPQKRAVYNLRLE